MPERRPAKRTSSDTPVATGTKSLWSALDSDDVDILIIKGSAGTGKTTSIARIIDLLRREEKKSALMASTGRAAKILRDKTGVRTTTIHSQIYRFNTLRGLPDDEEQELQMTDAGQLYLRFDMRARDRDDEQPDIYIVDEASMITHEISRDAHTAEFGSGSLLDDLISYAGDKRIIFVGDHCQLPPISENPMSSALTLELLAHRYGKRVVEHELTHIWRHPEGSEILDLADYFRRHILAGTAFKGMRLPAPGGEQVSLVRDIAALTDAYIGRIGTDRRFDEATIIAASNKMVAMLNTHIRKSLGLGKYPEPGDLLQIVQNCNVAPLYNGDLVILLEYREDVIRAGIMFSRVRVKSLHDGEIFEALMIDSLLYSSEPRLNNMDAGKLFVDFDKRMRLRGIGRKTQGYRNAMLTDPYLNALRCKYGYALTCHKAQGGEWDHVFLAMNGALYYQPAETAARWYYTAITRAKHTLMVNDGPWVGTKLQDLGYL